MTGTIGPLVALLASCAILLLGNGLLGTLIPLRASIEAFPGLAIGAIGSAYFAGFAASCLVSPHIVRRVGHIRAFVALTALASAAPLLHILAISPASWILLRSLTGFCVAGLYMVIESWLNERATNANRGMVLSVYTIVNLSALTGGQLLLTLGGPDSFALFCVGSILVSLAALPIAMTSSAQPAPIATAKLRLGRLYAISPVGIVGCFVVGLANGPFWALGSVFAHDAGLGQGGIALFMSAVIVGGALLQWPLGGFSDRRDRRWVILALTVLSAAAGGALVGARLGFGFGLGAEPSLLAAAFLFGGFALPLYSICVAHANDFIGPREFTEAAGGLLLAYGIGAAIGPLAASALIGAWGAWTIFAFTAAVHLLFAGFVVWRLTRRRPAPPPQPAEFVGLPRTTPVAQALDPRAGPLPEPGGTVEPDAPDDPDDPDV